MKKDDDGRDDLDERDSEESEKERDESDDSDTESENESEDEDDEDDGDENDGDEDDEDEDDEDENDEDENDEDEDDEEEGKPEPPPRKAKSSPTRARESKSRSAVPARSGVKGAGLSPAARAVLLGVVGLGLGALGGWFLRDARAKGRAPFAHTAPVSSALSAECKSWQNKICEQAGDTSAGCDQAKAAAELMPVNACGAALDAVPESLSRLKLVREVCVDLTNKLCNDLGKESQTCKLVQSKTERMPPENCRSMQANYPAVLSQLQMLEQRGMMGGGHPGAHGMPPPGHPAPPPAPSE